MSSQHQTTNNNEEKLGEIRIDFFPQCWQHLKSIFVKNKIDLKIKMV